MNEVKRSTIFKQLIYSVLIPVFLLITFLSLYNYYDKRNQAIQSREESIDLLQNDLVEFLDFFDLTILELEKDMREEAKEYSNQLVNQIFKETNEIETANLDSVKVLVGMGEGQDIYIVDSKGIIVNTTYAPDLGLDFFGMGEYFVDHFGKVWESQEFVEDRISIEISTKSARKYTYQSTLDTNYVIELGLYNEPSKFLLKHFIEKLDKMPEKYSGIDTVSLFLGTNKFMCYQGHVVPEDEFEYAMTTLETGTTTEYKYTKNGLNYTAEYHFIEMSSSHLHGGYVLRVVHNDEEVQKILWAELKAFLWNLVLFIFPIFIIILWRARNLSRPISNLVAKIDLIQQKSSLNERVEVVGNNEVSELSEHFNSMIDQLEESYNNLEQKVADRTAEVRKQKEIIEEVFHEIQDSIMYAKRLQNAILPSFEEVNKELNNFILYQPKDVVSGDFYWFEKKDGVVFIAAADCTGHGVPGAMVSVVCSNALNRSVNEFNLIKPSEILDKTRELVIETFSKSGENVKDGMDISLCSISGNKLEYAGANNPLWIVRNNGDEIEEIKADKQPIGKFALEKPFTNHELMMNQGDQIYLFTDGFADQFGGEKGKKLKYKPFKSLLVEFSKQPLASQLDNLNTFFEDWKSGFEQLDDVCVIGVRI